MGNLENESVLLSLLKDREFALAKEGPTYKLVNPKDAIRWIERNYDFSPKEYSVVVGEGTRPASSPDEFVRVDDEISKRRKDELDKEYGEGCWALVEVRQPGNTEQIGTKTFKIMVSREYIDEFRRKTSAI